MWITLNEPLQSAHQGYRVGSHAPGRADLSAAAAATHHLLLGHGLAMQAIRATLPAGASVGIALDPNPIRAFDTGAKKQRRGSTPNTTACTWIRFCTAFILDWPGRNCFHRTG